MTDNQHWIYQGRQSHGWFGSGTAPDKSSNEDFASAGSLFSPAQIAQRIDYAAFSLVGHVSPRDRGRSAVNFDASARDRLKTVIAAWYGASELSRDAFRARFLDPYTSDQIVDRLRSAAFGMVKARTYETLNAAGKDLADAVQQIGLDRWPRYLADADRKAVAAVSDGAIPDVVKVGSGDTFVGGIIVGGLIVGAILGSSSTVLKLPKTALNPPSPTVVEAVAVPPRKDGETPDDILKPGGRLVGNRVATLMFEKYRAVKRLRMICLIVLQKAALISLLPATQAR